MDIVGHTAVERDPRKGIGKSTGSCSSELQNKLGIAGGCDTYSYFEPHEIVLMCCDNFSIQRATEGKSGLLG